MRMHLGQMAPLGLYQGRWCDCLWCLWMCDLDLHSLDVLERTARCFEGLICPWFRGLLGAGLWLVACWWEWHQSGIGKRGWRGDGLEGYL